MLQHEEYLRLGRLLKNLSLCTGVKFAIMDDEGEEIYSSALKSPFCHLILDSPVGSRKCRECDRSAVNHVQQTGQIYRYRCHAGLRETAIPVLEGEKVVAVILFGQIVDAGDKESQWERTAQKCVWYPDQDNLREAFLHIAVHSEEEQRACEEIIQACVSEVRLHGLAASDRKDEAFLIQNYISTRYYQPITSSSLCRTLNMSKTRLYALCAKQFNSSPMQLVLKKRMEAAMGLLTSTDDSISRIAESVGFADVNYFSKVFRRYCGSSPRQYRSSHTATQE